MNVMKDALFKNQVWRLLLCSMFFVSFLSGCTKSEGTRETQELTIEDAFIYVMPPGQTTAAAYMVFENNTDKAQSIVYVHSSVAEHIEVHRNFYEDGVMQMRPVKKMTIQPKQKQVLEPSGFHLMVFGVYDEFAAGDSFDVTFEFDSGLVITQKVEVRRRG